MSLWQDVKYEVRVLRKNAGFASIAILTLALGIGANTALFSVVNAVLLNPLPFPNPGELMKLYQTSPVFGHGSVSYLNLLDWQKDNRSFEEMAASRADDFNLTGTGEPVRVHAHMMSSTFLSVLGVHPILGRDFRPEEDLPGAAPVALLGERLWKSKFGSASDVVGRNITMNGESYTIVGVAPSHFAFQSDSDVYTPIGQWNDPTFRDRRISMGTQVLGRLKPGVTFEQAKVDMDRIGKSLGTTYPESNKGTSVDVITLKSDVVGDVRGVLLVLLGAVSFVLLIACANVANLLLARSTGRTREFAIRSSLGAGPWRVVRQLLTESVLLGVAGGALGLLLAEAGIRTVLKALSDALPRADEIHMDWHVLAFTAGISVLTGVIFGLAPAVKLLRPKLSETLKEGGRGTSTKHHRLQSVLVAGEMALALVLLIGAGLMIRSLAALWSTNPGFDARGVTTFAVSFSPNAKMTADQLRAKYRESMRQYQAVSGVQSAALVGGSLPMTGDSELPFWKEGQPKPENQADMAMALFYLVTPDYAKAMGIPLLRGRFLTDQDNEKSTPVVVIDASFARKYFAGENPVGKHLNLALVGMQPEIVGVVGHVKHWGLGDTGHNNLEAEMYIPVWQIPDQFWPLLAKGAGYVVKSGPGAGLAGELKDATSRYDATAVVYGIEPMEQIVSDSISTQRLSMILLSVFSALALVLSAIGIYGVISYLTGQRTQEIGIRMALGASRKQVLRMVLGDGMKVALIGVGIGLVAAVGLTRLISKLIYGVSATDPLTFAGVAVLLTGVALLASYLPARKAMGVDPIVVLRYE